MDDSGPILEILTGPEAGTGYRLLGESSLIGRSADCDIRLADAKGVSRRHARLRREGDRVYVEDLGSQNGTLVDGARIEETELPPGAELGIGEVRLRLRSGESDALPAASPSATAAPAAAEDASPAAADAPRSAAAPPGPPGRGELPAEETQTAGSRGGRAALSLAALLLLVGGGLYAVSNLTFATGRERGTLHILRVRESRVLMLPAGAELPEAEGLSAEGTPVATVEPFDGLLRTAVEKANERARRVGGAARRFVTVTGRAWGGARLRVPGRREPIEILVRSFEPYRFETDLTRREALDMADRLVRESQALAEDDQLYPAIRNLEAAYDLLRLQGRDMERANAVRLETNRLRLALQERLETLYLEAMRLAFPDPSGLERRDIRAAYTLLQEAKRLVPDESSPDWQALTHWEGLFRRMVRRGRR